MKARLLLSIGDDEMTALAILEPALDPKQPNERVIDLLAELKMKAGELDEAEKLYELARKDDPFHTKWIAGLARVHLRQKKTAEFLNDLAMIAANDADDIAVRKALAERHLAAGDAAAAEKWADECLYIDVYDPSVHVLLADAQAAGKKYVEAIEEYQTALELKPKKPNDLKVKLAQAQLAAGQRNAAKATIDGVLKADPEHPEAKELREPRENLTPGIWQRAGEPHAGSPALSKRSCNGRRNPGNTFPPSSSSPGASTRTAVVDVYA